MAGRWMGIAIGETQASEAEARDEALRLGVVAQHLAIEALARGPETANGARVGVKRPDC